MVYKSGTFSAKMVHKRVRGWISGRSLPVLNFVKYPLPQPGAYGIHIPYFFLLITIAS